MAEPTLAQVLDQEFSKAPTPEEQLKTINASDLSLTEALEEAFNAPTSPDSPVTPRDMRRAVITGAGVGAASGLTVGGAAAAGMRIGASLPLPTPARTPAIIGGGILGFGIGLTGSSYLNQLLESNVPERYLNDRRLMPYYQGGRTFGETIGAAPLTFGMPVMQGGRVANFMSRIGTEARLAPKATIAQETFSATGAGLAGGAALAYNPESEGLRFGAEALGGMFAPPKMLLTGAQNAQGLLSNISARFSQDSRENMAATYLNSLLRETGEDPNKLVNRLLEPVPDGVPSPTAGQMTGSLALQVLENTLARENPAFGTRIGAQGQRAFLAYQNLVDRVRNVGTPEAYTAAARMERDMFQGLLNNRLMVAEQNAASRIARIRVDRPETRASVGRILQEEVENALADAREYEQALWRQAELEAVDIAPGTQGLDDAVVTPRMLNAKGSSRGVLEAITSVTPEYLRGMQGYGTVQGIMSRLGINKGAIEAYENGKLTTAYLQEGAVPNEYVTNVKNVPVSYLVKARGDLLSLSRAAASSGDVNTARVYNDMAEALMSDMDKLQLPAYDRAREYSRELNDTFTRTYARELTAPMRTGARKLSPEIIVARAFNSNNDITAQRMSQVMNSTSYLNRRYERLLSELGPDHPQVLEIAPFAQRSAEGMVSTADAQRQWLLLGANRALEADPADPNKMRVNRGKLNTFIAENQRYLQEAGLLNDLQDADRAEAALQTVLNQNSAFNKGIKNQAAFAMALGRENPVKAVSEAINGQNPVRSMRRLSALARSGGRESVDGFKSILYDYAFSSAGGMTGNFSPAAYYDTLFEPISRNQPSLIQFMTQSGMMTQMEKNNLRRLLLPMVQIENAVANKQLISEAVGGNPSAVQRLAARYVGARAGSALASGAGSGASIQIPGFTASALDDLINRQPNILIKDILQRAAQDPQLAASLIQRADPRSQTGEELARKLAAQLGLNGINVAVPAVINPLQYEPPQQDQPTGAFSAGPAARQAPAAPATRGVPGFTAPAPAPAPTPGPLGSSPAAQGSSREMLQRLFPFDTTLSA
jgi:hypothetical protein